MKKSNSFIANWLHKYDIV